MAEAVERLVQLYEATGKKDEAAKWRKELEAIKAARKYTEEQPWPKNAFCISRWPREDSPFKLGQWGLVVNILGLVWGLAMEINFLWPRNAAVGGQNPPLSALPNLSISGPISNIPVFEFTLGVILLVGLIYWAIAQRRAPDTSVAPAEAPA